MNGTPPHSPEAERAVLGAMLINNAATDDVVPVLGTDGGAFYEPRHRDVYAAAVALRGRGEPVDAVTITKAMAAPPDTGWLAELLDAVPTSARAEHYARTVRDCHTLRELGTRCAQHARAAFNANADDARELLDAAEASIFDLRQDGAGGAVQMLGDVVPGVRDKLAARAESNASAPGVPTGMAGLDDTLGGLQEGDLVIVAARPSVGKTALALNIAHHAATTGTPTIMFSLEMGREQLGQRLLCIDGGADLERIRTGFLLKTEMTRINPAADRLASVPLAIDDTPALTVWQARSEARKFHARHGKGLVVIDYLQLMRAGTGAARSNQQRYVEVGEVSRGLKQLARELRAPVVVCCQLGRGAEKETDPFRMLPYLRESGDIEQDADVVIVLSRLAEKQTETLKQAGHQGAENIVTAAVVKHRNGPLGKTNLLFEKNTQRFMALANARAIGTTAEESKHFGRSEKGERFDEFDDNDDLF